jgi:hypothetical protein
MVTASPQRRVEIQSLPGRLSIIGVLAVSATAWLLALYGLVRIVSITCELGRANAFAVLVLAGAPIFAIGGTRWLLSTWRTHAAVPRSLLERRYHGSLDAVTDSEQRALRPIGTTAVDVAARTGTLLTELVANPSVRIFRGVRPTGGHAWPTTHAVAAGRSLVLVESVAWPPGHYRTGGDGRVHCDDVYIGQSVGPLLASLAHWRRALPRGHRVIALVVVHHTDGLRYTLPESTRPDLVWSLADEAVDELRRRIGSRPGISRHTLAALIAATPADRPL